MVRIGLADGVGDPEGDRVGASRRVGVRGSDARGIVCAIRLEVPLVEGDPVIVAGAAPVKGYGLAIMTNANQGGAVMGELSRRIQVAYEWDSVAEPVRRGYTPVPERTEVDVDEDILKAYVGEYELEPGSSLVVSLEDGYLFGRPGDEDEKLQLFAESETTFFLKVADVQITFTRDDSGVVNGAVLRQSGAERQLKKVR